MKLSYLLPKDRSATASGWLFENKPVGKKHRVEEQIATYQETVRRINDLLSTVLPMIEPLDDGAALTYLHDCLSWSRIDVRPPEGVQLFESSLYDTDLLPGLEPILGDRWIKLLAIHGFPTETVPALLDRLISLPLEYWWTSRFLFLNKQDAETELNRVQRQWFAKRKSLGWLLMGVLSKEESALVNTDALNKAADADAALTELAEESVG